MPPPREAPRVKLVLGLLYWSRSSCSSRVYETENETGDVRCAEAGVRREAERTQQARASGPRRRQAAGAGGGLTAGEVYEDRLNARSCSRKMRFLFLAWAFLLVRKPSKPCGEEGAGSVGRGAAAGGTRSRARGRTFSTLPNEETSSVK